MQNLLERLRQKYSLKIGELEFSPIMQCSIGLAMLYVEEVKKGCKTPFHLNYPEKHKAALWLSISLLRNFFLEDYINQAENRIKELNLQPGEIIEIFGANAEFLANGKDEFCVEFKNGVKCYVPNRFVQYVNKDPDKSLNTFSYYKKNKKNLRKKRNAISKIIEPDDDILINQKALTSKVLVVAGHGHTGSFRDHLKNESIYDTSLSEVFSKDDNIILKSDLESLKFISQEVNDAEGAEVFEEGFLRFIDDLFKALPEKKDEINELKHYVKNQNYRTEDFRDKYDQLLELIEDENDNVRIFNVRKKYPGVRDSLPDDLKVVVINDFDQLNIYQKTIDELLSRGIPVFIISNRYVKGKRELSLFKEYFSNNSSDLRINWNKKKISELITNQESSEKFLDKELWDYCFKFMKQRITIVQSPEHPLDSLVTKIQTEVSRLEGFERLKEAYWKYFNPLIYSFKNEIRWREYHEKLILAFEKVQHQLKETINSHLNSLFHQALEAIKRNKHSNKDFCDSRNIFIQSFGFDGNQYRFPKVNRERPAVSKINVDTDEITFPGFPLNEPIGHYLMSGISKYYVSDIQIYCWPIEGKLTYSYIRSRLKAGYFFDNIPAKWGIDSKFLIKNEGDIDSEVDSSLDYQAGEKVSIDETLTDELEKISAFKYSGYKKTDDSTENYLVTCNIIDFEDGSFMFLPKNSTVLARIESNEGSNKIKRAKFRDLNVGDSVFEYQLSRHDLRELTKNVEGSGTVYNTLEIWKKSLLKTYENCNKSIRLLSYLLSAVNKTNSIGANPTRQNIRRWLFDDDMLAPEEENLRVILLADEDKSMVKKIPKILNAFGKAKNLSSQVSRKIKSAIIDKLKGLNNYDERSFSIDISGHSINVQYRNIVNLQDTDIEIEYSQTRKFVD